MPDQAILFVVFGPWVELGAVVGTEIVDCGENGHVACRKMSSEARGRHISINFTISCRLAFETMIEPYRAFPLVREVMFMR